MLTYGPTFYKIPGTYLAIIKGSRYSKVVNVAVCTGCHLRFLDRADAALGV
jgi:hypothetical protein